MKRKYFFILALIEVLLYSSSLHASNYQNIPYSPILLNKSSVFLINQQTLDDTLTATISANQTAVCINSSSPVITFSASNGSAPYTFTYKINNATTQSISTSASANSVTLNVPTNVAGTFSYNLLSVTDALGANISIIDQQVSITVGSIPSVDFTFSDENCSGKNILFTSHVAPTGNDYSFLWEFGDNTSSTESVVQHQYMTAIGTGSQTFTVKLTVTDNLTSCSNSKEKTITLVQHPDPKLIASEESDTLNGQVTFRSCSKVATEFIFSNPNQNNPDIINYTIDWGDGTTPFTGSSWSTLKHTYNIGMTTLKYTIQGKNGCSVTKEYKIFVGTNPGGGIVNPGNTDICVNNEYPSPFLEFRTIHRELFIPLHSMMDQVQLYIMILHHLKLNMYLQKDLVEQTAMMEKILIQTLSWP